MKQKRIRTSTPSASHRQSQQSSPAVSLLRTVIDSHSPSQSTTLQSKSPAVSTASPTSTKSAQLLKDLKASVKETVEESHMAWSTQLRDFYKSSFITALSQLDTSEHSLKSVRKMILDPLMRKVLGIDSADTIFQLEHSSALSLPIPEAEGSVILFK